MDVSQLELNDESVGFIVRGLAGEVHDFALARDIPSHSVDLQLPLIFGILSSNSSDLLNVSDVAAVNATDVAGIRISFSDEGYRLLAKSAQDRAACPVDVDRGVV